MNLPSVTSSASGEIGPYASYDELLRALGPSHPVAFRTDDVLFFYDCPRISRGRVGCDPRPRLDIYVEDRMEGENPNRIHTTRCHQLVFTSLDALTATLHACVAPTVESYRRAVEIIEYELAGSEIDAADPRHSCTTRSLVFSELNSDDLPPPLEVDGIPNSWSE